MKWFDSLTHITADGGWLGANRHDASLETLLAQMDASGCGRACLVGIADHVPNEPILAAAKAHPGRFVPIAGFNPAANHESSMDDAIARIAARGFAGIKLHPRLNGYDPLDARVLAAIDSAAQHSLAVFFCTLCRQSDRPTRHIADIVDHLATRCHAGTIVLLHGGGASMMDLFELVRMHKHLILDLSFSILRYAGSSIDADIRFLCEHLDERLTVGSDFPQFSSGDAFARLEALAEGLPAKKLENILHRNLSNLFGLGGDQG